MKHFEELTIDEKLELYITESMHDCKDFLYWYKKNNLDNMRESARYAIHSLTGFLKYSEVKNGRTKNK